MYSLNNIKQNNCPLKFISNILGKKWVCEIIWEIGNDKKRFGELQRCIEGCSKKMLIQQLEFLIENGIVINDKKELKNNIQSTYYLSECGVSLLPIMETMILWSNKHIKCDC
ncbi:MULTISPECIES: winged helix-turn-helix transcriptional regulator [Romboutsia]|uniref:HxlR-type HTH domain profile n=1 Tax=Romboutsia hominis TaxID=1507512 RepID=A0A2P2BNA8_9FIRM|nr:MULTISPECIES: helix-turn-helix domain-containing protein [Romboutsia]MCH1958473.1 helix-turn-helix transcriptional regulator [Romboutsia hominis]MCH1970388.1 helix-turn-helix transcriptional regulator [Romboutsia hominis]MDB8790023.1 helix-turn-helix domain-containing protein [Romboutsia sp. 1001216sp1]MDB8793078.1 helix-turn-helix domain-containing protein [Romboutsia sp. 1001216sp1]MDB8795871.1 helix-turn-helix domain-containing protein [Romboutsia sp. 1001216sp1]